MNRFLLALLALLTGLTAQAGPASARVCGLDTEVAAADCTRSGARATATQGAGTEAATRPERREREASRPRPSRSRVYIPTVQFGADRAFE